MGGPERFKTYGNVFDEFTLRNLFKLSSQGFFEDLVSPISIGKEANVFSAVKKDGTLVAVKIYRLENCNFNKMWSYLASDPRYKDTKPRRREVIFSWVQREFRNLLKSREAGVRVPTPIHFYHNIIVEEFIGQGKIAAPQLHKVEITPQIAEQVINNVVLMYKKAHLVHADLSSFNILFQDAPVFIDMSQATATDDPNAKEYIERDVYNMVTFFEKHDISYSSEEILQKLFKNE